MDVLDLKEIVCEELNVDYAAIINDIKKAVKIFNENSQPDFDDSEILKACAHAVGACVRIVNINM